MSPGGPTAVVVLAGGRSARMGADKAGLEWEGATLLGRLVEALAPVGEVVVVRAPGQALPALSPGARVVEDAVPGRGPLEGALAGLGALEPGTAAFLCAVDMPLLDAAAARAVLAALGPGYEAAVPRVAGRAQPLAAAYRAGPAAAAAAALLTGGARRMHDLLGALRVRWIDDAPGLAGALADADTPGALDALRQSSREKATTEPADPSSSSPTQASAVAPASEVTA